MNLKKLLLTIATVRHEPRLLREAFSPDVVSGKKCVTLPEHCWRDAVLNVVWPDGLPKALQNHYCPLFWVSNMFPILWIWCFLKFCGRCISKTLMHIEDVSCSFFAKQRTKAKNTKKEAETFKFFKEVESLSPALIYEHIFKTYHDDDDYYPVPFPDNGYTVEHIPSYLDADREWKYIENYHNFQTHLVYKLKQTYGGDWKQKAVELVNLHVSSERELEKKQVQKDQRKQEFKQLFTLKTHLKQNPQIQSAFQRLQESRQIAKITEISHNIFKYGFVGMGILLGVSTALLVYNFLGKIIAALEWCLDLLVTILAFFYLERNTFMVVIAAVAITLLVLWIIVQLLSFLFQTRRGEEFLESVGNAFKIATMPIWWPIVKVAGIMVDLFELACNIVKMTYNENCPAIEREGEKKS